MMKKFQNHNRSKEEKERILLDIQRLGIVAGCRKHNIVRTVYYDWLKKYEAHGIEGLSDQRGKSFEAQMKKLEKENKLLKEIIAERDLEIHLQQELLKKRLQQWKKEKK
jgi:putative transposase